MKERARGRDRERENSTGKTLITLYKAPPDSVKQSNRLPVIRSLGPYFWSLISFIHISSMKQFKIFTEV